MLNWLRFKAWQSAVGADFEKKYGINIYRLSQATVGPTLTKSICETVVNNYYHDTVRGGEQIARVLEQANGVPVNKIIQDAQFELIRQGKRDDFLEVPYSENS
jgi:hypothetical protein